MQISQLDKQHSDVMIAMSQQKARTQDSQRKLL